ncbi:MAG TPA: DUF3189 family protein [Bacillota bacterium]|nr:DUF3189 family protein [Bacillota bacterium]
MTNGDGMKIVYHCYGGAHSSVVAAAVHLGRIPLDRLPGIKEIEALPLFDRPVAEDHGLIRFMGRDEYANDIFTLGCRNGGRQMESVLRGLAELIGPPDSFAMVDALPYVNWLMMLGGASSRRYGLTRFGRPIVAMGVQHFYWDIVNVVKRVKLTIASNNQEVH